MNGLEKIKLFTAFIRLIKYILDLYDKFEELMHFVFLLAFQVLMTQLRSISN